VNKTTIRTYTGREFDFMRPRPESFTLLDCAVALGREPRFNGHTIRTIVVAEHSLLVLDLVMDRYPDRPDLHRCALMHDGPEAFAKDLPKPLKGLCGDYETVEDRIWREAFVPKWELPSVMPVEIKEMDRLALRVEQSECSATEPWAATFPGPDRIASHVWIRRFYDKAIELGFTE